MQKACLQRRVQLRMLHDPTRSPSPRWQLRMLHDPIRGRRLHVGSYECSTLAVTTLHVRAVRAAASTKPAEQELAEHVARFIEDPKFEEADEHRRMHQILANNTEVKQNVDEVKQQMMAIMAAVGIRNGATQAQALTA